MALCQTVDETMISYCQVIESDIRPEKDGESCTSYGIRLFYTDGMQAEYLDLSTRRKDVERLAQKLSGQDVAADALHDIVYDFLCGL